MENAVLKKWLTITNADAHVHLETKEDAENEGAEPAEVGDAGVTGLPMWGHPTGLLANSRKRNPAPLDYK